MKYLAAAAVITLTGVMCACQGRHADATPNGETVEVNVEPVAAPTPDTIVVNPDSTATTAPTVTTVN